MIKGNNVRYIYFIGGFLAAFITRQDVSAETLTEALAQAYDTNPTLAAAEANLRSTDETAAQATAAWLPTVGVSGSIEQDIVSTKSDLVPENFQRKQPRSAALTVNQNIYQGGATSATQRQVQANIKAAESTFRKAEQDVLLQAVQAYLAVLNAQATLRLSKKNEELLSKMLQQIKVRFDLGDVTLTDVAQVEARLAEATAQRIQAEGALETARAQYEQQIGTLPGELVFPENPPIIPTSEKEALEIALSQNPDLIAAIFSEKAAQEAVDVQKAGLSPKLDFGVTLERDEEKMLANSRTYTGLAKLTLSVPLDLSGATQSTIRQYRQTASQKRLESRATRRAIETGVTQAFESLKVAEAQVKQFETQVASTALALKGVRLEEEVGQRTVLDILNQEKENYDAEKSLVNARVTYLLAHYQLLGSIGQLNVSVLELPVKAYNPATYLEKVQDAPYGTAITSQEEENLLINEEQRQSIS